MNPNVKYIQKVWYILGDSKHQIPFLLLVFVTSSIIEAFGIGLLGPFFKVISNTHLIRQSAFFQSLAKLLKIQSDQVLIAVLCVFVILIFIAKSILYFASKFYILRFSHLHREKMIQKLYRAYLESEYSYFSRKNSSTFTKNTIIETENFCSYTLLPLLYGLSNILILFCLILLMWATDALFLVVTLASLLPVILVTYAMRSKLRKWGQIRSQSAENVIQTLNHGLGGFKETRIIGSAPYFQSQMQFYSQKLSRSASLSDSFGMLPRILTETTLVVFVVTFVGISQLFLGRSIDSLIASLSVFAVASIRLLPAASQIMAAAGDIQNTKHVVDILYLDLKESEEQLAKLNCSSYQPQTFKDQTSRLEFNQEIEIQGISYSYDSDLEPAIKEISLKIKKGESIAFIGQSGAGKTTLVDIILGLLIPQSGQITLDGTSIYSNPRAWQNLLGYVPQSIFLLDDTVAGNIAFGVPKHLINYQKLENALAAAQLQELVAQLPEGTETRVGERGVMLSGGQRQRIGIARALYHEREILVLDEATSALDGETEEKISKAIRALAGKKTLITIAHRLSTVEHCDRVYELEKGQIVKAGSYAEVVTDKLI